MKSTKRDIRGNLLPSDRQQIGGVTYKKFVGSTRVSRLLARGGC